MRPLFAVLCMHSRYGCHRNHSFLSNQTKFESTKKQMESVEMEVMEARLIRASELNGEMDDDDAGQILLHNNTN